MNTTVQHPQLNLNGSRGDSLQKPLRAAYDALNDVKNGLREGFPHGRDYQTLPSGSYERARAEHEARFEAVQKVQDELLEIFLGIEEQMSERAGGARPVSPQVPTEQLPKDPA